MNSHYNNNKLWVRTPVPSAFRGDEGRGGTEGLRGGDGNVRGERGINFAPPPILKILATPLFVEVKKSYNCCTSEQLKCRKLFVYSRPRVKHESFQSKQLQ